MGYRFRGLLLLCHADGGATAGGEGLAELGLGGDGDGTDTVGLGIGLPVGIGCIFVDGCGVFPSFGEETEVDVGLTCIFIGYGSPYLLRRLVIRLVFASSYTLLRSISESSNE